LRKEKGELTIVVSDQDDEGFVFVASSGVSRDHMRPKQTLAGTDASQMVVHVVHRLMELSPETNMKDFIR
jgi:hypothetical protein